MEVFEAHWLDTVDTHPYVKIKVVCLIEFVDREIFKSHTPQITTLRRLLKTNYIKKMEVVFNKK